MDYNGDASNGLLPKCLRHKQLLSFWICFHAAPAKCTWGVAGEFDSWLSIASWCHRGTTFKKLEEHNTMRGKWCLKVWRNVWRHCPKKKTQNKNNKLSLCKTVPIGKAVKTCENQGAQSSGPLAPWMIPSTFAAEDGSIIPAVCISLHFWQHENLCQSRSQAALGLMTEACPSIHRTLSTTVPFRPFHLD